MTSIETLKTYFNTGDTPTEAQFSELIEALSPNVGDNLFGLANTLSNGTLGDWVKSNGAETGPTANSDNVEFTTENLSLSGIKIADKLTTGRSYKYRFKIKKVSGTTYEMRAGLPTSVDQYTSIALTSDFQEITGEHSVTSNDDFWISCIDAVSGGMVIQVKDFEIWEVRNTTEIDLAKFIGDNLFPKNDNLSNGSTIGDWYNGNASEVTDPTVNSDNTEITTENFLYSGIRIDDKLKENKFYAYRFQIKKISGTTVDLKAGLPGSADETKFTDITITTDWQEIIGFHTTASNMDFYISTTDAVSGGLVFQVKDFEIWEIKSEIEDETTVQTELNFNTDKFVKPENAIQQTTDLSFTLGSSNIRGKTIQYAIIPDNDFKIFLTTDFIILNDSFINGGVMSLNEDQIYLLTFFYDGDKVQTLLSSTGLVNKSGVWADAVFYNNDFSKVSFDGTQTFYSGVSSLNSCTFAINCDTDDGQPSFTDVLIGNGFNIQVLTSGAIKWRCASNSEVIDVLGVLANGAVAGVKIAASYDSSTGAAILNINGTEYTATLSTGQNDSNRVMIGGYFNPNYEFSGTIHEAAIWTTAKNSSELAAIISAMV